ncbi:MAG: hypothetical protein ACI8W0_001632 [Flavobacterium sp.]|jgi:hypothetical protein
MSIFLKLLTFYETLFHESLYDLYGKIISPQTIFQAKAAPRL